MSNTRRLCRSATARSRACVRVRASLLVAGSTRAGSLTKATGLMAKRNG